MSNNSLNSVFKNKSKCSNGHTLPIFVGEKKTETQVEKLEPCLLISSKTSCIYTPEATKENNTSIESKTSKSVVKSKEGWKRIRGLLIALLGIFMYSITTLILKLFNNYHPLVLSLWRFQGMVFPSIPILIFYSYVEKKPVFKNVWPLTEKKHLKALFFIFLRSILGCTGSALNIFALKKLNMADVTVIGSSFPVFVTLAAHVFLGEKAGFCSILTAVFTIVGVGVIARPPMLTGVSLDTETLIGTCYAISAMLLSSLTFVILRHLRQVHYSVVTISYGVLATLECTILAIIYQVFDLPHGLLEWTLAIGLITCTFLGQTAIILALKFENAGPVSLVGTTDVVFAFIWQFIFLSVLPDFYSLIGASIIILGVILTAFRKWIGTLPDDHETKLKFLWILN